MTLISDTTLCCIDCLNHEAAIRALKLSMKECQFDRVLFLTNGSMEIESIEVISIPELTSSQAYSEFVLKDLTNYIETNYVLLVQWDGYILDGNVWQESYKQYDYIGSPWPWKPEPDQIGNGGFSWRSKKLLNALQDQRAQSQGPEDEDICLRFRQWLTEDYGINFSPVSVANKFAYERSQPTEKTFGFHGLFNMHRHIPDTDWPEFIDQIPPPTFSNTESLELAINLVRENKYEISKHLLQRINQVAPNRTDIQYLLNFILFLKEAGHAGKDSTQSTASLEIEDILKSGMQHHKQGLLGEALQLYSLASLVDAHHPEPKNLLGILCMDLEQLDSALLYFQQALSLKPDSREYHNNLEQALLEKAVI